MRAAPGRRQRLTDELRRARDATGGWIDTDFYKDFMQVLCTSLRQHYNFQQPKKPRRKNPDSRRSEADRTSTKGTHIHEDGLIAFQP